jgi:hypothetical protein
MGVLWDKVWRDLWENKGRTLQVVLIIAVGTFAIGMIIGTRQFMITGMETVWRASAPATIYLWAQPGIDEDALAALGHIDGVTQIEGMLQQSIEWRLAPGDPWQPAALNARDSYEQLLSRYDLISGDWPHRKQFGIGQGGDAALASTEGDTVYLRVADREPRSPSAALSTTRTCSRPALAATPSSTPRASSSAILTGSERL